MRVIIMAGGKGTRLRPYTTVLPKPLMPVGEQSILEIIIRQLKMSGATKITLAINHMSEIIRAFAGDGSKWMLDIDYSEETEPLGTIGPLKLIPDLPDNFIVMNGDVLTDLDYGALYKEHTDKKALLTIAIYHRILDIDFGVLQTDDKGNVVGFQEKPRYEFDVSMGIYVFNKSILEFIPQNVKFGLDQLVLQLLDRGMPINTSKYSGYWLDIGRPDDYDKANLEFDSFATRIWGG